ncbi:MAG: winged helix-turn-helix domain-containing protein [Stellaceae bacterium]
MDTASEAPASVAFGRFLLLPHRRELLANGRPVKLGGRAFDVLMALVEARGAVVSKNALMARVWPERIVEENNLQWQISALRAAFGVDRNLIRTVSGRGYQFTGEINAVSANPEVGKAIPDAPPGPGDAHPDRKIPAGSPPTNLPEPVSELVGREDVLGEILSLASAHRLVTLTGAGGIGKTRLAVAAARRLLPQFADGVWLAEFSPIADPGLVPVTAAAAIGLDLGGGAVTAQRVSQALAGRRLLLVLDTCEHVIGAAAALVEAVLRAGRDMRLLATSREPLRAEGEWVYPVPPLAVPAEDAGDADDLLRYGGVRLFVERARAAEPHFAVDRRVAGAIAMICRRLDGIPLAIELAAARSAMLGVDQVAARLDDRFHILTGGRRTALPRQQTLRATLDWSYKLLAEPERVILRRLAIFAGAFSLGAAGAVAANPDLTALQVTDSLFSLVTKSLVAAEVEDVRNRYRLLDTTRAYALEKLDESGERQWLARRHAEYYRSLFERGEAEWEARPTAESLIEYARDTDNLRAALDWAFSPEGNAAPGIALTAAAVPLWMQLSLLEECRRRVEQALAALTTLAEPDARQEMKLLAALGASRLYTRGGVPEVASAWTKALELAKSLGDLEYQKRSLWGLWSFHVNGVDYRTALSLAHEFACLATTSLDRDDRFVSERMIGISHHNLGDQPSARLHIERALAESATSGHQRQSIRLQLDPQVTARVHLARILWLQGFPDRAMREAERSVNDARAAEHAISFSYALHRAACPVPLWNGDLAAADHYADMLLEHAKRHALAHWQLYGWGYQGAVAIRRGDLATGLRLLRSCFEELGETGITAPRFMRFAAVYMAEGLGKAGQVADAFDAIDDAIARAERTEELWQMPELLRVKGELVLLQGAAPQSAAAEDYFRQALDWARRQGALSWELRSATSLARLLRDQGRSAEATALLQPVYDRFTEGFETADLKTAKALLDALHT